MSERPETIARCSPPERVLHVFGVMNRGGAETLVMNVYRALDRERLQFDFAVATERIGHYDDEIRALGGRILPHPNPALDGMFAYRRALGATLRRHGPFAAVHSHVHHFSGVVLESAARAGVARRIAHSHGTSDGQRHTPARRVYRAVMRHLIRRYGTHLLGCSPQACEALYGRACWDDPRVAVVANGVPLQRFTEAGASVQLRRELGIAADTWLVGHVGSFTPAKNHERLIDIFGALRQRRADAHLVLVGDGPGRPHIESLVRTRGLDAVVHFTGIRSDVPELMADLDVLLLPSRWEGFPVTLVEAQAAGLPAVVSAVVSATADLGLGLVRFVPVEAPVQAWCDEVARAAAQPRRDRAACLQALKAAGYDAADVTRLLCDAYA